MGLFLVFVCIVVFVILVHVIWPEPVEQSTPIKGEINPLFARDYAHSFYQTEGVKKTTKTIKPYIQEKIYHNVVGIWANRSSIAEFKRIENDRLVDIRFESNNPYDKNALAVFSKRGVHLGHIRRNQRKLILTLRQNPNVLAHIIDHDEFYSNNRGKQVYRLALEIWVGFSQEELDEERQRILQLDYLRKKELEGLDQWEPIYTELTNLKDELPVLELENPQLAFERFLSITHTIIRFNQAWAHTEFGRMVVPLDKLTIIAMKQKDYAAVVDCFNTMVDHANLTDNQMEKLIKRVNRAKEHLARQN